MGDKGKPHLSQPDAPQIPRVDPIRVNDIQMAGSENELVAVFKRTVFSVGAQNLQPESLPSAAIAMSWITARALYSALERILAEHDAPRSMISTQPSDDTRPN